MYTTSDFCGNCDKKSYDVKIQNKLIVPNSINRHPHTGTDVQKMSDTNIPYTNEAFEEEDEIETKNPEYKSTEIQISDEIKPEQVPEKKPEKVPEEIPDKNEKEIVRRGSFKHSPLSLEDRAQWDNKCAFFLSALGSAVGLGKHSVLHPKKIRKKFRIKTNRR